MVGLEPNVNIFNQSSKICRATFVRTIQDAVDIFVPTVAAGALVFN